MEILDLTLPAIDPAKRVPENASKYVIVLGIDSSLKYCFWHEGAQKFFHSHGSIPRDGAIRWYEVPKYFPKANEFDFSLTNTV